MPTPGGWSKRFSECQCRAYEMRWDAMPLGVSEGISTRFRKTPACIAVTSSLDAPSTREPSALSVLSLFLEYPSVPHY